MRMHHTDEDVETTGFQKTNAFVDHTRYSADLGQLLIKSQRSKRPNVLPPTHRSCSLLRRVLRLEEKTRTSLRGAVLNASFTIILTIDIRTRVRHRRRKCTYDSFVRKNSDSNVQASLQGEQLLKFLYAYARKMTRDVQNYLVLRLSKRIDK